MDEGDGTDLHLDAGGERMVVVSLIDQTFGGPWDLTILATVRHDGTTSLVENGPHQVDAPSGAALPPSGINLGVTALSNGASLLAVASGWLVVMVLLLLRRDRVHERGRRAPTVHAPQRRYLFSKELRCPSPNLSPIRMRRPSKRAIV